MEKGPAVNRQPFAAIPRWPNSDLYFRQVEFGGETWEVITVKIVDLRQTHLSKQPQTYIFGLEESYFCARPNRKIEFTTTNEGT